MNKFYPNLIKGSVRFPLNGIIPIYKERGISSANVTNALKYLSKDKIKIGHGGTLDVDARGLLIVGFGSGCKDLTQFLGANKTYNATAHFGYETSTFDSSGELKFEKKPIDHLNLNVLNEQTKGKGFIGKIQQVPPVYSAIKVNGLRLSDWAVKGASVIPKAREVTVYNAKCTLYKEPFGEFDLEVSSGFYVRSYLTDVAKALNTVCYSVDIFRTKVGFFNVDDALRVEDISEGSLTRALMNTKRVFKDYIHLSSNQKKENIDNNNSNNNNIKFHKERKALLFDYQNPKYPRSRMKKPSKNNIEEQYIGDN